MKNQENPVMDLLIEASNTAATLILKRRKLFRNGGSALVNLLKNVENHSWLKVSIPVTDINRNGWDLAHETAARFKKELGQAPYIEPDKVGGRFDTMNSEGREPKPDHGATKSAFGVHDPQSMINNLMPQTGQIGLPSGFSIPGMTGMPGMPGVQGFGGMPGFSGPGAADPFMTAGFGRGSGGHAGIQDPNKEIMEILKGTGFGTEFREISVPAMQEVPGWEKLAANTGRMLEVEASQLLLSQMPGVALELHSKESLRAVAEMEACSNVLRRFLEVLPAFTSVEVHRSAEACC